MNNVNKIVDLEQRIMECWNVADDLHMLYEYFGDHEFFAGMSPKHSDEIMNKMLAVKELYELKFQRMWDEFELVTKEFHERGDQIDSTKLNRFEYINHYGRQVVDYLEEGEKLEVLVQDGGRTLKVIKLSSED